MAFQVTFKGVNGSFKKVSIKFQRYFKIGSRVFQSRLKGVSSVFERSSK